jgi:GPI transamidase subunit PIG-U
MFKLGKSESWGIEFFSKKNVWAGKGNPAETHRLSSSQSKRRQQGQNLNKLLNLQSNDDLDLEPLSSVPLLFYEIKMSIDRRKATLFGAAAAVRLLLFTSFPGLPDLLTARVEISTPVTSFKRCEEIL